MKTYNMSLITKKVYDSPIQLFSLTTLQNLLEITKDSSFYKVIKRLMESEVLIKIERNKYILKNYLGSDFTLANFIYEPSYISFESALSHHGILSQFPYEVTSATSKQTRSKEFNGKQYGFYHFKRELFWGYTKESNALIAEKEKALLDQLYLSSKGLKKFHWEEYDLSRINKTKLQSYLLKYPQTKQFKEAITILLSDIKI